MLFANDHAVWLSWRYADEQLMPKLRHTNEVVGCFVNAGTQIYLDIYLDRLQDKPIFCDMDSVVYIQPREEPALV